MRKALMVLILVFISFNVWAAKDWHYLVNVYKERKQVQYFYEPGINLHIATTLLDDNSKELLTTICRITVKNAIKKYFPDHPFSKVFPKKHLESVGVWDIVIAIGEYNDNCFQVSIFYELYNGYLYKNPYIYSLYHDKTFFIVRKQNLTKALVYWLDFDMKADSSHLFKY